MKLRFQLTCALLIISGVSLIAFAGCHRGFYRRQADKEAEALIRQKACDPRWNLNNTTIDIAADSRMFDPFSADHPPIPPDDPTSHQLMRKVDGKPAFPHWHANGDTNFVENPEWVAYLPINESGVVEIDLATAFNLALTHSPDYQSQKEELYLSALDVSLQRFGFDSQLFSGFNSFVENNGSLSPGGSSTTLSTSLGNQGVRLQKLGITGSTLVIGLANSMIWQFAGPNTQTASTLIDFSIIQPLLQGGGRDRVMESLTQSERSLLANVRQMERYRRGFYLQVVIGRNPGQGPSRGGNFLGAPSTAGRGAGGVLGILQSQQQIRIQEYQVNSLKNVLEQFYEEKKAERIPSLQVAQTQTQLYNAQNSLLSLRTNYQSSLDSFKQQLGLPPDLPVVIKDPILNQFELIDDENNNRQIEIDSMKKEFGEQLLKINEIINKNQIVYDDQAIGLKWNKELKDELVKFKPSLAKILPVAVKIREQDAKRVQEDFDHYESIRESQIQELKDLRKFIVDNATNSQYAMDEDLLDDAGKDVEFDPDAEEVLIDVAVLERVPELRNNFKKIFDDEEQFPKTEKTIRGLESKLDELIKLESIDETNKAATVALYDRVKTDLLDQVPQTLTDLSGFSVDLSLLQARARTDSISVPKVDITAEDAIKIAREFRRDWMNARASLVDQWRQVEFSADDLESTLDLVMSGSVGNNGSNPFSIRAETGTLRGGFQFDTPITRMSERNSYRETLIRYQQARRRYYQFEDAIKANLREIVRQIALNRIQFEINRRGVKVSIQQVEESRLNLSAPQRPGAGGRSSTLSRDLTDAIQTLQVRQNGFLDVWVRLESLRRNLDFDMGTMNVDDRGFWIDPGEFDKTIASKTAARYGIDCDPLTNELMIVPSDTQIEPAEDLIDLPQSSLSPRRVRNLRNQRVAQSRRPSRYQSRLLRKWYADPADSPDSVGGESMVLLPRNQKPAERRKKYRGLVDRFRNPLEPEGVRPETARLEDLRLQR